MTTTQGHKIEKRYNTALIGGLGGRTRRECWGATIDDIWNAERIDDVGTPWVLTHIPTNTTIMYVYDGKVSAYVPEEWGSLAKVIHSIETGQAARLLERMKSVAA